MLTRESTESTDNISADLIEYTNTDSLFESSMCLSRPCDGGQIEHYVYEVVRGLGCYLAHIHDVDEGVAVYFAGSESSAPSVGETRTLDPYCLAVELLQGQSWQADILNFRDDHNENVDVIEEFVKPHRTYQFQTELKHRVGVFLPDPDLED